MGLMNRVGPYSPIMIHHRGVRFFSEICTTGFPKYHLMNQKTITIFPKIGGELIPNTDKDIDTMT